MISKEITKVEKDIEFSSFYENEIIDSEENFYNLIYSGSLFGKNKIITIYDATDKIINKLNDIYEKFPEGITIIIFSDILEKKSKLRNLFEKEKEIICIPCYLDNEKDLGTIAQLEFKKNNIALSREAINLLIEKANFDRNNLRNENRKNKIICA